MRQPSVRAQVVARRSYHRPLTAPTDGSPPIFENWPQVVARVISHQTWLWHRALHLAPNEHLPAHYQQELNDLRGFMLDRVALTAGRTLWMGGTNKAKQREASQFNCAFLKIQTPSDLVDAFWLLLQGCGVGFKPDPGCLFSFQSTINNFVVIPSLEKERGDSDNHETYDRHTKTWTIKVGDSAEAWAKAIGKLVATKHPGCEHLIFDCSEVRRSGIRLPGYGWVSHGYKPLAFAASMIFSILNDNPGQMLEFGQIHEITNLLGTVLSTRRSAELCLCDAEDPWADSFALFKKDMNEGAWWKSQSNNTLNFNCEEPPVVGINHLIDLMVESGGSEPGIRNAWVANRRARWSKGTNPCAEILLPDKGFCNLVEINVSHPMFMEENREESFARLKYCINLFARANYRQTCVNLNDGILQRAWHENNENLRLCGVGLTGLASRPDITAEEFSRLREAAHLGANSMADELGLPRSKAITTCKPSGTLSKVMDCKEGFHDSLSRYLINKVCFSVYDPMVPLLRQANYVCSPHPKDSGTVLIDLPVDTGAEPLHETAVQQLDRYAKLMHSWCDHNVSCTIYYTPDEVQSIKDWLSEPSNWKSYVAISFLPRVNEGTYDYMPQTPITAEEYQAYVNTLSPVDLDSLGLLDAPEEGQCSTGQCPVR